VQQACISMLLPASMPMFMCKAGQEGFVHAAANYLRCAIADLSHFCVCSVCPFYSSRADIVPNQYVNPTWAAYPPEPEKLGELYELVCIMCHAV
jgi:hypothetical protein